MAHHPPWFDPSPPGAGDCVLRAILQRNAVNHPERACVEFGGEIWSSRDAADRARRTAGALAGLGVEHGERVLVWLPSSLDFVRSWFGIAYRGAVPVPLNVAYRGGLLEHAIALSGARTLIAHTALLPRLGAIGLAKLETVIVCGGEPSPAQSLRVLPATALDAAPIDEASLAPLAADDIAAVLFTSGTTGPSKGVLCPYAQMHAAGMAAHGFLTPADRLFMFLPLFHTLGLSASTAAIARGATLVLAEGFRAASFWDDVRRAGCNRIVGLISSLTAYLATAPVPNAPCPVDFAMISPVTATTTDYAKRLGFRWYDAYGMTETSSPLVTDVDTLAFRSCGRPRSGIECRIVDSAGNDLRTGQAGELILRSAYRPALNAGYLGDTAATAETWRGGWFHTGDMFRRDDAGNYYFVDRLKDAIRRRGENISSFEVENEIAAFPGIAACAAVAVPAQHGDDEVLAVVAPTAGQAIDPSALIRFLAARMTHFMVPRYVRIVPELPRTATNKVQKATLRAEGITPDTWDREAAGIVIRRDTLGAKS